MHNSHTRKKTRESLKQKNNNRFSRILLWNRNRTYIHDVPSHPFIILYFTFVFVRFFCHRRRFICSENKKIEVMKNEREKVKRGSRIINKR